MKNSIKFLTALFFIGASSIVVSTKVSAQQWNGSSSVNGNIYRNGNVGIGATTPVAKLDIFRKGTIGGKFAPSNASLKLSDGNTIMIADNNEIYTNYNLLLGSSYNEDFEIRNVDKNGFETQMIIKGNGNVGFGNTAPEAKLDIFRKGTIGGKFAPSNASLKLSDGNTTMIADNNEIYTNANLLLGSSYKQDIEFRNVDKNGFETQMIIKSNGNVGIGITNPNEKLVVDGTIKAEELIVENVAADYVFSEGFNLRPLEEVESFIKENGHLPDVAPASETVKGIKVSEFNTVLLQKIEELTLYMIELKKENEELKASISQ